MVSSGKVHGLLGAKMYGLFRQMFVGFLMLNCRAYSGKSVLAWS